MTLATAALFGMGFLGVGAFWLRLGQPKPSVRWPAVAQAAFLTWPALRDLRHIEWVLVVLAVIPLLVKPRPHVGLGRFAISIMGGMLLAGVVAIT